MSLSVNQIRSFLQDRGVSATAEDLAAEACRSILGPGLPLFGAVETRDYFKPGPNGEAIRYLRRYFLTPKGEEPRVWLHHFTAPDGEDPHDHPWRFSSLVLSGGFTEEIKVAGAFVKLHHPVGVAYDRQARDIHRIADLTVGEAWTLLVVGPYERSWFFYPRGKDRVPWRIYTDADPDGNQSLRRPTRACLSCGAPLIATGVDRGGCPTCARDLARELERQGVETAVAIGSRVSIEAPELRRLLRGGGAS